MFAKVCTAQRAPAARQVPPPKAGRCFRNPCHSGCAASQVVSRFAKSARCCTRPAASAVGHPAHMFKQKQRQTIAMKPQNKAMACTNAAPAGPESPITLETSPRRRPMWSCVRHALTSHQAGHRRQLQWGEIRGQCLFDDHLAKYKNNSNFKAKANAFDAHVSACARVC